MKAEVIVTFSSKTEEGISEIKEIQQMILCGAFQRELKSNSDIKIKATFKKLED